MSLDRLAGALEAHGLSPRELAEVAWLAARLAAPPAELPSPPSEEPAAPEVEPGEGAGVEVGATLPSAGGSAEVGAPSPRRAPAARTVVAVARAPARSLGWQRAMARLAAAAAEGAPTLDVAATVARSAEYNEPWLVWARAPVATTALVVLEEPAGQLEPWRAEVEALLGAARRSGGFVSVDHQWLTGAPKPLTLRPGQSALVLLVTDGLREPPRAEALRAWLPRGGPSRLAWLNPWGPTRWHRTASGPLGEATPAVVPTHGVAGWTAALLPLDARAVAALEGWARGRGSRGLNGVRVPRAAPRRAPAEAPTLGSEERARQLASVLAAPSKLALGLAAAVPGYVDVELLTGLGRALGSDRIGREHLTEALASGLFERVAGRGGSGAAVVDAGGAAVARRGAAGTGRRGGVEPPDRPSGEALRGGSDRGARPPVVARFVDAEARRAALGWLTRSTAQAVILELVRLTKAEGRDLSHLALPVRLLWGVAKEEGGDAQAGEELPEACQALLDVVTLARMDVPAGVLEEIGRAARRGGEAGRVPAEVKEGLRVVVCHPSGDLAPGALDGLVHGLRQEGVAVEVHALAPGFVESWSGWLDRTLARADKVIVVGDSPVGPGGWPWRAGNQDRSNPRRFRVVPLAFNGVAAPVGLSDLVAVPWDGPASTPALLRRLRDPRLPGHRRTLDLPGGVKLELAFIPAGTFAMGSPEGVGDDDERPRHVVPLSRPYWIGVTPVTQAQWAAVAAGGTLDADPSHFKGADRPVEMVSWDDARAWCNALSTCLGLDAAYPDLTDPDAVDWASGARLPSEAEWERACRAGSDTAFSFGDDEGALAAHGVFGKKWEAGTSPVGGLRPNPWGLHDVHGNVWEWCWDAAFRTYTAEPVVDPRHPPSASGNRCVRGGSFISSAGWCRSAYRFYWVPSGRYLNLGLRVVVPAPATP